MSVTNEDYEDEAKLQASLPKLDVLPVQRPDTLCPSFSLFPKRTPKHDERSRYVSELLKHHRIR